MLGKVEPCAHLTIPFRWFRNVLLLWLPKYVQQQLGIDLAKQGLLPLVLPYACGYSDP